jgi:hypothetical protein
MKRNTLWLGLLLVVAAVSAVAANSPSPKPAAPAPAATNAPNQQVIAYYFHGTVRCETCQKIERQAREVIEQRFKPELTAQRLVFKPLNYDLPENAHCRVLRWCWSGRKMARMKSGRCSATPGNWSGTR